MVWFEKEAMDEARERAVRNRAYVLVTAGIVIVLLAYVRLLGLEPGASMRLPLVVALLGLLAGTMGFASFHAHARRTRFTCYRPSRAACAPGPLPSAAGNVGTSSATDSYALQGHSTFRHRQDFPDRN